MQIIQKTPEGYKLPGFINAHVHVESSHLCPAEFGRMLVRHGTLAAVCDPHEIVNVAGEEGLAFMLENAKDSPADLFFELPSCVPATPFETSGAVLNAEDTARLFDKYPSLIGLGEMMNVPGVLNKDPEVMKKLHSAKIRNKIIDGHFPGGHGENLKNYTEAGISSDHESSTLDEAREKLAAGMWLFIREGSAAKNLDDLLPIINDDNWERCCFCSDDISAADLLDHGEILNCVRKAVKSGMSPERAVAMASINPSRYFGMELSDDSYVIVDNLVDFNILKVVKQGIVLVNTSKNLYPGRTSSNTTLGSHITLPDLANFAFPLPPATSTKAHAIGVIPSQLVTTSLTVSISDIPKLARLAVLERYGKNGNIAYSYAACTGLVTGAIASTIAHDSHNIIVLGTTDEDMKLAVETVAAHGGACVVNQGKVLATLELPIGGLMSTRSAEDVASQDAALRQAAKQTGCLLEDPVATLSFLALPVIPELKLTDKGLFDTVKFAFIPLYS